MTIAKVLFMICIKGNMLKGTVLIKHDTDHCEAFSLQFCFPHESNQSRSIFNVLYR